MKRRSFETARGRYFFATTAALGIVIFTADSADAQQVTFEEIGQPPQTLTTEYSSLGVLFPRTAVLDVDQGARTPPRVVRAAQGIDAEFHGGPLVVAFTGLRRRVALFAGLAAGNDSPIAGTLRGFNAAGQQVAVDGPKPVTPNAFTTRFEISAANATIQRVELQFDGFFNEAIDNLESEGESPPPPPTEAPIVEILSPADGAQLDLQNIMVSGTAQGEGLFRTTLSLAFGLPPGSTAPPLRIPLQLTGAGGERTFEQSLTTTLGPHTITVEVENVAGSKGSDSVSFVNLTQAIVDRHLREGGDAAFGPLQYGSAAGGCQFAVYQRAAIFADEGTTRVVRGDVFTKWSSLRASGAPLSSLGCPTEEERSTPDNSRAQTFQNGRVYAGLATGTHHVPAVFVNAIDLLGGEVATGVPMIDPTESSGVMQTWLFQRFTRPDQPQLLPSTLEIRGNPPVLYVERQGGDLSELFLEGGPLAAPRVPTLWLQFPCSGLQGPCQVVPPASGPALQNAGTEFCDGTTYPFGPPEWAAVLGDHVATPLLGIVRNSNKASQDNPWTHEYHEGLGSSFASDWNVSVRPLHPFRDLLAENTFVEVEFEAYFANVFFAKFGFPVRNDLYFTTGRWIIDCGHGDAPQPLPDDPYRSEIHPPFVAAHMNTQEFGGRPATQANIWVNGYYTGEAVGVDIFPPPRPSPTAILNISKPVDAEAAVGVSVAASFPAFTRVRVQFTAPQRQVQVGDGGEMLWEAGRAYYGRWHVWWTEQ
jgi:hypothetical protein